MRFARLSILALVLLVPATARAHDEPSPVTFGAAERDFSQTHLTIRVRPDFEARTVRGRVTVQFTSEVAALTELRLHAKDMQVHQVTGPDGAACSATQERGLLRIALPAPLARGKASEVTIDYTASPRRGLYFHGPTADAPDTPTWVYSQGQSSENRRWIPCYDEPDDRVSWDLYVDLPKAMQSVSNGVLVEQAAHGARRIDHWRFADRSPTYLISLVAGEMIQLKDTWEGVSLEMNAPKGHATEAQLRMTERHTPEMMAFFRDFTGRTYPWKRYAQTLVWDFLYGGMENVTATTLNMRVLHAEKDRPTYRADALVAHELAHMWFGDLLTCRTWDHLWLNEGFATYFTDLFFEHHHGTEEFLVRRRTQNRRYLDQVPNPETLEARNPDRDDIPAELNGWKAYNRGAAILHMLRRELGDATFQRGIQAYVARHADQAVVSEQLRRVMEEAAGRDLQWFWKQWVYGTGYPVIEVRYEENRFLVVRQVQTRGGKQGLFRFRLRIRPSVDKAPFEFTVFQAEHRFDLAPDVAAQLDRANQLVSHIAKHGTHPHWIRVDPGGDLLARVRVKQPGASWAAMLGAEPDLTGRMDAAEALTAHGDLGIPALAKALADDASWAVRRACALALGKLGGARVAPALLKGAADSDARVRVAVAEALGDTTRATAGATLRTMAEKDANDYVRSAAAESAGRLKIEGALALFAELVKLDSHRGIVQRGALAGLVALGDPRGVELALPLLPYRTAKGAMHQARQAALTCITKLGPDRRDVKAAVAGLLDDPYFRMRWWAAGACGTLRIRSAEATLKRLWLHDWNSSVRGEAHRALEKMDLLPKK